MFWEQHNGKLWVSGGRDEESEKPPTLWGFSVAQQTWEERPLEGYSVYLPLISR